MSTVDPGQAFQQLQAAARGGAQDPPGNQYVTATLTASYSSNTLQVQAGVQPRDDSAVIATIMTGVLTPDGSGGNTGAYGMGGPNGNVPSMEWVGLFMAVGASAQPGPESQGFVGGYLVAGGEVLQYFFSTPVTANS
jgi:hypothetical protein